MNLPDAPSDEIAASDGMLVLRPPAGFAWKKSPGQCFSFHFLRHSLSHLLTCSLGMTKLVEFNFQCFPLFLSLICISVSQIALANKQQLPRWIATERLDLPSPLFQLCLWSMEGSLSKLTRCWPRDPDPPRFAYPTKTDKQKRKQSHRIQSVSLSFPWQPRDGHWTN